ncbi:MAG: hypothetical protein JW910_01525 [Anaerolineae bacterium]|nr:hypothetical protein [Anaerolineae bacterium]
MNRLKAILLVLVLVAVAVPSAAQGQDYPLYFCEGGAFSTEEDFMTGVETYDGLPYISDGDLLSLDGRLCARSEDLLRQLDIRPGHNMGLDAVDILDFDHLLVAFSTELDSPHRSMTFTHGDVLLTTGAIIPNSALTYLFDHCHKDAGLDAVQFVGDPERILEFANSINFVDPHESLDGGQLQGMLEDFNIDIWFSTESTLSPCDSSVLEAADAGLVALDGDVLSARFGLIVYRQDRLFDDIIPAGIPERGVDFGLDAFQLMEWFEDVEVLPELVEAGEMLPAYFSTEILYRGRGEFTDGDVLEVFGNVVIENAELVEPFAPVVDFLGLDALWLPR